MPCAVKSGELLITGMIDDENDSEGDDARHARVRMSEAEIDYNLMESFPASDPRS